MILKADIYNMTNNATPIPDYRIDRNKELIGPFFVIGGGGSTDFELLMTAEFFATEIRKDGWYSAVVDSVGTLVVEFGRVTDMPTTYVPRFWFRKG